MRSKLLTTLIAVLLGIAFGSPARAQFAMNNQTNTISGVSSNWVGNGSYVVGSNTFLDALLIKNGVTLSNGVGYIGYGIGGSNNAAIVSGSGSAWSNNVDLYVGNSGAGNSLVISNGGKVFNGLGEVGFVGSNNVVTVAGGGSIWSNRNDLYVGNVGAGNQLIITNGGAVFNGNGLVGNAASAGNNAVTVAGSGSIWSNRTDLYVGTADAGNQITISSGGAVFNGNGYLGFLAGGSNNVVTVAGSGSVWSNRNDLYIGDSGLGTQLIITNGGAVFNGNGLIGNAASSSNNMATVAGSGSVWNNRTSLYVGSAGASNTLNIGTGGSLVASNAYVGFIAGSDGNKLNIAGGSLYVTNAGNSGTLDVRRGTLTFSGGTITVDSLLLDTGSTSLMVFNSGTINTKSTYVANAQQFVVGDGANAATFHLLGGTHSFNDGLRIHNNASLTGCGTINGNIVVDAGGTVVADCGGSLTFTGILTNNGTMRAINASVLESYGAVVNNGLIDITGGTTDFHSTFVNNGSIINGSSTSVVSQITGIVRQTNDIRITWLTTVGTTNALQVTAGGSGGSYSTNGFADIFTVTNAVGTTTNYLDVGGATNKPARYYRVRLVP